MASRRERIEAMLVDDPNDSFLLYSLAMDYRGGGEIESSLRVFDQLIHRETPHVPAFFMSAQMLVEADRIDEARSRLRDGIEQARMQNDSHAAAEMSELLASLGSLGEL
jgi:tetratricopeptide (TPR) repeat protein